MDSLFHLSEVADIVRFDPRPAPDPGSGLEGRMVWAIDAAHRHNYLLPRDCPRVTFYARPGSSPADARLMGASSATYVVAIESGWFSRVVHHRLYQYELPADPFVCLDAGAGYWIAREPVISRSVTLLDDLPGELLRHDVKLRVMPSLWQLRDAVVASTLQFSVIRLRNAQPRRPGT